MNIVASRLASSRRFTRWRSCAAVACLLLLATPGWAEDPRPPAAKSHPSSRGADIAPPVDILCRAAVAMALAEPERARSFVSRARIAGWLPEFHFRVFRRFARTEGLTLDDTAATVPLDVSAVDDVRYEWRATWDLSRMVFNPDELHAHAEALRMSDVRRDIQSLVVRLYFERRRLLSGGGAEDNRPAPSDPAAEDERRQLRALEVEAQLDAITGGAFSRSGPEFQGAAP
jgi:hypothetical protein